MVTKIDNNGNIINSKEETHYASGDEALLQNLANRLRLLKGEARFQPTDGVDYEYLFNNNNHPLVVRTLTAEVFKDPRVAYVNTAPTFKNGTLCIDIYVKSI